ncbi:MAG: glycosyltransferase family 4 protein [Gemmataceae bacterium]|nr:glycosyltransferase family 4 protein [Gemmataceae bacterium]
MRLTTLIDSPDHVCCRYRIAALRPYLGKAGHQLELRPAPRRWWEWCGIGRELRHADAVILQRRLLQRWKLWVVRRSASRLLFDLDDAVFLRDSYSPRGLHAPVRLRRFAGIVRAADAVIAGNAFLAECAARYTDPDRVHVVPTCIDPGRYPIAEHPNGTPVQLAWVGSSSTLRGLDAVRPMLESLGRHVPGLRLKLICDSFLAFEHLPVVPCRWTEAREGVDLATADIGISWMPDDDWSRGKCGLKVLQYMAAGLPVVANPVGVHREMVRHGVNGFLAETAADWVEAVAVLARDPGLRRTMGAAGRRRVEWDYSVTAGARRWAALLDRLGGHRQAAA